MKDIIVSRIKENITLNNEVLNSLPDKIVQAAQMIISSLSLGGKLLVFGNGGSAADAQHIAAEIVGRYKKDRKAMAAIALTTDSSILTAVGNDYGFDSIFSRQIEALGAKGDVALGISTSGNSKNVDNALKAAKAKGLKTIGLLGGDGGQIAKTAEVSVIVPSKDTPRVQESQILIGHIICELIEKELSK